MSENMMRLHCPRITGNRLRLVFGALAVLAASPALAAGEGGGRYYGDWGQAIAALLIFLLLMIVLGRWAWRPIVTQLRRREDQIAGSIKKASEREEEAQELLAHYTSRLDRADAEAKETLARSREEAAAAREQILAGARLEAKESAEQAKEEIEQAKRVALLDLYDTTAQLAADIAGRVIRKGLSDEDHSRLVRESLDEISKHVSKDS